MPTLKVATSSSSHRPLRGLAGVVCLCLGLLASGLVPPVLAEAGGLTHIGDFVAIARATSLPPKMLVDPGLHRGFVADQYPTSNTMDVVDLENLNAPVVRLRPPASAGVWSSDYNVIDPVGHRLFAMSTRNVGIGFTEDLVSVLDTSTLRWGATYAVPTPPEFAAGDPLQVTGLTFDPRTNRIYFVGGAFLVYNQAALAGSEAPGARENHIVAVDADTGALDWTASIDPPCNSFVTAVPFTEAAVLRYGDALYITCNSSDSTAAYIYRLSLGPDSIPPGSFLPGTKLIQPASGTASINPAIGSGVAAFVDAGAGHILMMPDSGSSPGAFIMDVETGLFRGIVAVDSVSGAGLDQTSGRLYLETPTGLIVDDTRHSPLPGGLYFPRVQGTHTVNIAAEIAVDPTLHRVFVPELAKHADGSFSLMYRVYQDSIPPTPPFRADDPDTNTQDIAEGPATARNYSGSGNAYGAEWLSVGGPSAALKNQDEFCTTTSPVVGEQNYLGQCVEDALVSPGDRHWYMGHVGGVAITNTGASAVAAPLDLADRGTDQDLQHYQNPAPGASIPAVATLTKAGVWPTGIAACSDFGAGTRPQSTGDRISTAQVTCDATKGSATASSVMGGGAGTDTPKVASLTVGSASAQVTTHLDPAVGIVTDSNAVARGVSLAGLISIGEISAEARTTAHGRTGTAGGNYTRTIADFHSPTYNCASACDATAVVGAIDQAFSAAGIDARAYVPAPDSKYAHGTAHGYQAVMTKDAALRTSDLSVNSDSTDTITGLEIAYYADGPAGVSRQIFKFADVHAEAHYGVYNIPSGSPDSGQTAQCAPADCLTTAAVPAAVDLSLGPAPPAAPPALPPTKPHLGAAQQFAVWLHEGWRLLVSDPGKALMLAALLALLCSPIYLALRRRALLQTKRTAA